MPGIVDLHAHWIPPRLVRHLEARVGVPRIERTPAGAALVTWLAHRPLHALCDLDHRRALMLASGIERQMLSLPGLFGIDCLPVGEALPLVRAFNDAADSVGPRALRRARGLAAGRYASGLQRARTNPGARLARRDIAR